MGRPPRQSDTKTDLADRGQCANMGSTQLPERPEPTAGGNGTPAKPSPANAGGWPPTTRNWPNHFTKTDTRHQQLAKTGSASWSNWPMSMPTWSQPTHIPLSAETRPTTHCSRQTQTCCITAVPVRPRADTPTSRKTQRTKEGSSKTENVTSGPNAASSSQTPTCPGCQPAGAASLEWEPALAGRPAE